jgi:predicted ATPase/class 3 adenylate cyclase
MFSDVVGSTRLWEANREGMAASLAAHDRILEATIGALNGYVFSTAGDSFAAAFPTPTDALNAAIEAQLGLLNETWPGPPIRIRIGVHTGTSYERAGDYFGPDVNRAARVMAAANAGQVLVSSATAELVGDMIEPPVALVDRGVHALKDLERPEHIFELRHPDLPEISDPLRTALVERVHLPAPLTSFVGRGAELDALAALVGSSRLVTLTGVGGAGKTRLALEAASGLGEMFPDGVWMATLADISDPGLVVNEIAEVWGLRPGDGMGLPQVVKAYLASRTLLLILDNCEHVLGAAATLAGDLLASSPGLSILATSRETLGVPGETVYRVPSLGLPSGGSDLASSESVRLFIDRAALARPGFVPTAGELEAIARICRRLDGIPLGIELAAARIRTLTITDLATRLDESFRVLTAASKTAVRRQRTLENTIGWSYDLLSDEEAAMFRRLSVFAGGFDLNAAEVVGREAEVIDLLDQLVDKSLVVAWQEGQTSRFRLLEPIRQYGQLRLDEAGETENARAAHAEHFASRVAAIAPRVRGLEQAQANRELLTEADNTRAALATFLENGEIDRFLQVCFDLTWFWAQSSMHVEGRDTLVNALARYGEAASPSSAARAWLEATLLATFLTDPAATDFADSGLVSARVSGDETLVGWLTLARGMAYSNLVGNEEAEAWMADGRRMVSTDPAAPMWDPAWDQALVEFMLAFGQAGSPDERAEHVAQAINGALEIGDGYLAAAGMMTSTSLIGTGKDDWVLANLSRSVEILADLGSRHGLGHALYYHGGAVQDLGKGTPIDDLRDASRILAEVGDLPCSTRSAARAIRSLIDQGRIEEAKDQLTVTADRLLLSDDEVHAGLPALALRLAIEEGDIETAARFLGHIEPNRFGISKEALGDARARVESALPDEDLKRLEAVGAAADYRRVLTWIRDI